MDWLPASPFYELAALLVLAAGVGFVGLLLRQPMVVSFIGVGILAGPSVLDIVQANESIDLLADLGIAVLLFLVGLKLDPKLIRTLGGVSLATGVGQVAFTSIIGYLIAIALGLDAVSALYVAVALTFSSTIIIVKLLSDKGETDSLHGRIAIGLLIVQDLIVVLAMMVLSSVDIGTQAGAEGDVVTRIAKVIAYGAIALVFIALFMRYLATPLASRAARSPELLVTFSIAWAALLAAAGHYLGFSKELGGLLAGISLASTPFREAIVARLSSLRDFLLLFFFVALGANLNLNMLGGQLVPALVLSLFVLVGNPVIVMIIMAVMGYRKRTGFLTGLTVAQISEFSLIFMAMGMTLGHVNAEALGLVTLVGLVTIALSVYMITYSHTLYHWLEPLLGSFEREQSPREQSCDLQEDKAEPYDVVLLGLGRYGKAIAEYLHMEKLKTLAVDFNPEEVRLWHNRGFDAAYGDASDQDLVAALPLEGVRWVVCALPQHDLGLIHEDPRLTVIDGLRRNKFQGKVAVSTHHTYDIEILKNKGADLVLCPFVDAAESAVARIMDIRQ